MAKSSTARDERFQRARDRDASLPAAPSASKETVPADLDRLIHERVRLGIVSALAVNRSLTFNELKAMLKTTDGNLSVHARKLEGPEQRIRAEVPQLLGLERAHLANRQRLRPAP